MSTKPHVKAIGARTLRQCCKLRMDENGFCSHDTRSRLPDPLKLVERAESTRGCFRGSVVELEETTVRVPTVQSWLQREKGR